MSAKNEHGLTPQQERFAQDGKTIIADVKGAVVDVYKVKRHLMKSVHNIDILEIRA